jgi:hypothetical protein
MFPGVLTQLLQGGRDATPRPEWASYLIQGRLPSPSPGWLPGRLRTPDAQPSPYRAPPVGAIASRGLDRRSQRWSFRIGNPISPPSSSKEPAAGGPARSCDGEGQAAVSPFCGPGRRG